jgi:glycosyltransferase 2 family protein
VFSGVTGMIDILSVLPVILTIAALPISLSGIGVREQLFQKVLSALFGIPEGLAVMISVAGFLMVVFWGLVGGCVYLVYRPSGGLHVGDIQEQVESVEESIENKA